MKILVITDNYPSRKYPSNGIFLYKLVQKFVGNGHEVTVIAPQKIWDGLSKGKSYGEENARVIRPNALSFSAKALPGFNTYMLTHHAKSIAVKQAVKKHNISYDIIYGHFLRSTFIALDALEASGKPFFVAVGENAGLDMTVGWLGKKRIQNYLPKIAGFIAVSEQIREKLQNHGVAESKITVEPNGVDLEVFKKMVKAACRKKYNLPHDLFVLVFTGNFIHSKGPDRVLKAIEALENVGAMFIGGGPIRLSGDKILFNHRVLAAEVPELLNCADAFVLPTLHEGSNNSIIEAMACGLPIISSDIPEVRSQCDPSFSILVDPMDVQAIRKAIIRLRDDESMRASMSENAVQWARRFDLNKRAIRILAFLQKQIDATL
jgi:teichuronic acid biosynthesis glycosyltransferase TuaC